MVLSVPVLFRWGLLLCLAVAGIWDLRTGRVPNGWLAFWYGTGLWISACGGQSAAAGYLGRSLTAVAVLFFLFLCRMMGAGDIKCIALICGYLGFPAGVRAVGAGMALGAGWGLFKLVRGGLFLARIRYLTAYLWQICREKRIFAYQVEERDKGKATIPLVFFLFLGSVVVCLLGDV